MGGIYVGSVKCLKFIEQQFHFIVDYCQILINSRTFTESTKIPALSEIPTSSEAWSLSISISDPLGTCFYYCGSNAAARVGKGGRGCPFLGNKGFVARSSLSVPSASSSHFGVQEREREREREKGSIYGGKHTSVFSTSSFNLFSLFEFLFSGDDTSHQAGFPQIKVRSN